MDTSWPWIIDYWSVPFICLAWWWWWRRWRPQRLQLGKLAEMERVTFVEGNEMSTFEEDGEYKILRYFRSRWLQAWKDEREWRRNTSVDWQIYWSQDWTHKICSAPSTLSHVTFQIWRGNIGLDKKEMHPGFDVDTLYVQRSKVGRDECGESSL